MENEIAPDILTNYYAEVSFAGNQTFTTMEGAGTFKKIVTGIATYFMSMLGFSYTENRVTYSGVEAITISANILALVSHTGQNVEREIQITIYKNGLPVNESYGKVSSTGKDNYKAVSFFTEIKLVQGDYLEAVVCNAQGTEAINVSNLKLSLVKK